MSPKPEANPRSEKIRHRTPDEGMPVSPRVLLVEDDPIFAALVQKAAERMGWELVHRVSLGSDLKAFGGFDLILLDYELPDATGGQIAGVLERLGVTTPIVLVSAHPSLRENRRDGKAGRPFLCKSLGVYGVLNEAAKQLRRE